MPKPFSSRSKRPEQFFNSQTTLVESTNHSVQSSYPATTAEPTKPSLRGTIYKHDVPLTDPLLVRQMTSECLRTRRSSPLAGQNMNQLTFTDLAHALLCDNNPFTNMPAEFLKAVKDRACFDNGQVTLKGNWGPGSKTDLRSSIALLSELAQMENVTAERSRQTVDWRNAACRIEQCMDSLDTAVELVGFNEEQLLQSITEQWEEITGVKPLFNANTCYSEILDKWTMKTCGWKSLSKIRMRLWTSPCCFSKGTRTEDKARQVPKEFRK